MEVVVRGLGFVLHAVDPVADSPLAPDLWKLTEADAKAIAEPAARIANRYSVMRGAAGFSDEIGVAAALAPYVKRNLAERGRVKAAHAMEERPPEHAYQPEKPVAEPTSEPASPQERQPARQPGDEPEVRLAEPAGPGEPENPKEGVADALAFFEPPAATHLPPHEVDRG